MKAGIAGAFAFAFVLMGVAEAAAPRCQTYRSQIRKQTVPYCMQRSRPDLPAEVGEPVVYFFHGMMGDSTSWKSNGYAAQLEKMGRAGALPPFTVVSFETSGMSFFSDRKARTDGAHAYETWFLSEFMPKIEIENRLCSQRHCRGTIGFSMGGFGALKTALKHSNLFAFTAVNAPAIGPFNVWSKMSDWSAYFSRHPIGGFEGGLLIHRIRGIFTDAAMYAGNDPIILVDGLRTLDQVPGIYIDVGGKDFFGFQEGYAVFTQLLTDRQIPFEGHLLPDLGHDLVVERSEALLGFVGRRLSAH